MLVYKLFLLTTIHFLTVSDSVPFYPFQLSPEGLRSRKVRRAFNTTLKMKNYVDNIIVFLFWIV